jgi:hypothetical protein
MAFDWTRHYEDMAARFYSATRFMAPGKDVPPAMNPGQEWEDGRRPAWNKWYAEREEEALTLWHEKHGWVHCERCGRELAQVMGETWCEECDAPNEERETRQAEQDAYDAAADAASDR